MIEFFKSLKSLINFHSLENLEKQIIFYSENSSYTNVFHSIIFNLLKKNIKVIYVTSDKNDFFFNYNHECLKTFFISKLIGQIIFLNYIKCKNLILTLPDLENYYIKKSKSCKKYSYLFHSPVSVHMIYRDKAFFNYDEIFCVGQHQFDELDKYKNKYNLKNLNLIKAGYPKLDYLFEKYHKADFEKNKISVAPSWGKKNILDLDLKQTFEKILTQGYSINFRPHFQMFRNNNKKILMLKKKFENNKKFYFEDKNIEFSNIVDSEFLVTDWSGIGIEFAFITERPVLFIDVPKKVNNIKYNDLDIIPLEEKIREQIGIIIKPLEFNNLNHYLNILKNDKEKFKVNIQKNRDEYIYNFKNSSDLITQKILES